MSNFLNLSSDFDRGWFVGFSEGDGCFTSKLYRFQYCNVRRPYFFISQKDRGILEAILNSFGFGFIRVNRRKDRDDVWKYEVYSKSGLLTLIKIFNGKLKLTRRQERFKQWVHLFNANIRSAEKIRVKTCGNSISNTAFDQGWLAGFVDAEGCFTINKSDYNRLQFSITNSDYRILQKIKEFFGVGQIYKHSRTYWRYMVANWNGVLKIYNFFIGRVKTANKKSELENWSAEVKRYGRSQREKP
jgi:hypothetical protein